MNPFSINVSVSVSTTEAQQAIQEAFIRAYQDIGASENPADYLARKCEEYILGIFAKTSGDFMAESARILHLDEIQKAASIRKRIDAETLPVEAIEPAITDQ